MGFNLKTFILGGKTFCCCIPVRFGVLAMSFTSMCLAGMLAIVLWYESASWDNTATEKTAFKAAGVIETFLFVVSVLGFVGAMVRKKLFILIYAYFLYFHLLVDIGLASYILWMLTHQEKEDVIAACQGAIKDGTAQSQCTALLQATQGIFFGVASIFLLIEMYGCIIVARYVNQIGTEKRDLRKSRMQPSDSTGGFKVLPSQSRGAYATLGGEHDNDIGLEEYPHATTEFNPYDAKYSPQHLDGETEGDAEEGYGGGSWTHHDIARSEKARSRSTLEMGPGEGEEEETAVAGEVEELPDYSGSSVVKAAPEKASYTPGAAARVESPERINEPEPSLL